MYIPRSYPVRFERVFSILFNCLVPIPRQKIYCTVTISIGINKVLFCFAVYSISPSVWIDGIFSEELYVFLKKSHHFYGKENTANRLILLWAKNPQALIPSTTINSIAKTKMVFFMREFNKIYSAKKYLFPTFVQRMAQKEEV